MYRHILFPHDGSELSRNAEKECIDFAKFSGARMTVIKIVRDLELLLEEGVPGVLVRQLEEEFHSALKRNACDELSHVQKRGKRSGVECDAVLVVGGVAYKRIVDHAVNNNCDLIVMASHRRPSFPVWLRRSQTMKVLSHCHLPVLVLGTT